MKRCTRLGMSWLLGSVTGAIGVPIVTASEEAHPPPATPVPADRNRDGQHDFDFELGTW